MAQFRLTVDMDNAAFSDQYDGQELARLKAMILKLKKQLNKQYDN